ncbi:type II secretion protein F [Bordetella genomosp. 10]|uniref:Type II secretion protein F n=1 Tax=Bordetella genomosp. 10 TaxID=1416804 RepID=A0A261S0E1_9BORD|nr:type II secretion system F family protein [Bordetella genomosp. 10]OZI30477.1 type II secretion protein F [Bordetella genomosp. 10]
MVLWHWILACISTALLLFAIAILLWRHAGSGAQRAATSAFLDRQLGRRRDAREGAAPDAGVRAAVAAGRGLGWWHRILSRAGVTPGAGFYLGLFGPAIAVPAALLVAAGPFAAVAALVLLGGLAVFRMWLKIDRRQRRMLSQLPGFLESMVRLLTIGNSLGAAFQTAAGNVNEPLREVLLRADSLTRTGKELDAALRQVSEQYGLRQLFLLASVIGVAQRFGGRSDQILDRMAGFMRDVEQARDELSALSAEVRLSAWILALLPIGLAAFIIIFNNGLFMTLWNDPAGMRMLMAAVGLQIGGSYWLYRMSRGV